MARNPPFPIERIELVAAGEESEPFPRNEFGPESLEVAVEEPFGCEGGEECDREHVRSAGPIHGELTETYLPHSLVRAFDKWDLYQCKECGGFAWVHAARRDYL